MSLLLVCSPATSRGLWVAAPLLGPGQEPPPGAAPRGELGGGFGLLDGSPAAPVGCPPPPGPGSGSDGRLDALGGSAPQALVAWGSLQHRPCWQPRAGSPNRGVWGLLSPFRALKLRPSRQVPAPRVADGAKGRLLFSLWPALGCRGGRARRLPRKQHGCPAAVPSVTQCHQGPGCTLLVCRRQELLCSTSPAPGVEGGRLYLLRHRCLNCSSSLGEFIDLKFAAGGWGVHHNPQ